LDDSEAVIGLPGYEIISIKRDGGEVTISARYTGPIACPHCQGTALRSKGRYVRRVRHESMGTRRCWLAIEARKWQCRGCGQVY
jgi:transposase